MFYAKHLLSWNIFFLVVFQGLLLAFVLLYYSNQQFQSLMLFFSVVLIGVRSSQFSLFDVRKHNISLLVLVYF